MSRTTSSSPRLRLQFSLATLFALMTLAAIGTWYWYQRPFEIESKVADPFGAGGSTGRDVETVRRLWGGKTMRHGPRRVYDSADYLIMVEEYRNGQRDGQSIYYNKQGGKSREENFLRGKRHGLSRYWDSKGNLRSVENFAHGVRDGSLLEFYPDSNPKLEAAYRRGNPIGVWRWFSATTANDRKQTVGTIGGAWKNAVPDGHWEWCDAKGNVYLTADFAAGHCVGPPDLAVRGQALESVILAAGENPSIMSFLFRPIKLELAEVPLKDAVLLCSELANVPIRMDLRSLEEASISPDLKISTNTGDLPLFVNLSQLLRPVGLDCDFRYGVLRVVAISSLAATWEDPTGVTQIVPPPGSNLAQEWKKFTTVDVREMPLKDVVLYLQETHRVPFDISLMPTSPAANPPFTTQDSPITASLRGITLRDVLATILSQLHCKASLRGEAIVIEPQ